MKQHISKAFIFYILIALLIVGCNQQSEKKYVSNIKLPTKNKLTILANWSLADLQDGATSAENNNDELLAQSVSKKIVQNGLMLSFYPDETFTKITGDGKFESGNWVYGSNKTTIITSSKNQQDTFRVVLIEKNELCMLRMQATNSVKKMDFLESSPISQNYKLDPFYATNNTWRIKPKSKENSAILNERLCNYIKHIAYVLKAADDKKQSTVSFQFSQGIAKIYDGGIGIIGVEDIPENWVNTFYNQSQAMETYKIFENYLIKSRSYKGAAAGTWYLTDYNILTSIYGDLKEGVAATKEDKK